LAGTTRLELEGQTIVAAGDDPIAGHAAACLLRSANEGLAGSFDADFAFGAVAAVGAALHRIERLGGPRSRVVAAARRRGENEHQREP
jgi:hypothetical protein